MQIKFTSLVGSQHLILIFTGWATDWQLFDDVSMPGADVAVIWDYSDDDIDVALLRRYTSIEVYAWSFGVFAASRVLPDARLPIVRSVAINGTLTPVSDTVGIPVEVFEGTLNSLDERSLTKFYRRICGSAATYSRIKDKLPMSDIATLKAALLHIRELSALPTPSMRWDEVVISDSDAIFPPSNMARVWAGTPIRRIHGSHLPDFSSIFVPVDKHLVAGRFLRSHDTYDSNATVQRRVARRLFGLWRDAGLPAPGSRIIEIGAGTGLLTRLYLPELETCDVELWDLAPCDIPGCRVRRCDAESAIACLGGEVDCIASSSTLQWFSDASAFISNASRCLRSGGILAISTFGPGNMAELTSVIGPSLRYHDLDSLVAAAGDFDVVSSLEMHDTLTFPDVPSVIRHLRLTGTNSTASGPSAVAMARKLLRHYPHVDGTYPLTYHSIYLVLKRK